ncbi:MAG: hypothetical protein EAZ21_13475, partial [Betaproteobacteria bacterium]
MTLSSNLASGARRALRAAAHHLDPVVMIGDKGLTAPVLHEIDVALTAHALIKVRVASDDRAVREAFMAEICEKLACESVQHLGKLLVLWRNQDDGNAELDAEVVVANTKPGSRARGQRAKLPASAETKDSGFVRPTDRDPRPREGGYNPRGAARGSDRGEARAPRTGGYARSEGGGGSGYPRGPRTGESRAPYSQGRGDGYAPRSAPRTRTSSGEPGSAAPASGRFRRSDDAPAPDTRTPREGWAPRGRRGADRNQTGGAERDSSSRGFGAARSPRGGDSGANGASGEGFSGRSRAPAGTGYGSSRSEGSRGYGGAGGGASSGGGRWGSREGGAAPRSCGATGGTGGTGGAGAAP